MLRWVRHLLTYAVVNGFLIAIWLLTIGSSAELRTVATDPSQATDVGFWPVWPIVGWGLFVALHLVGAIGRLGRPSRRDRRRQRRADARDQAAALTAGSVPDIPMMPGVPEPAVAANPAPVGARAPAADDAGPRSGPRWVTVLFTDMVGSTPLNETLGDESYARLLREHREMVRHAIESHRGTEIGTQGDGFLVRFDSSVDAVAAACQIEREGAEARRIGQFHPDVRIGLHAGEAIEDGHDLVGTVINVAARVCGAANAGEVLCTEPVAEKVAGRVTLVDRGLVDLRGIHQPRHLLAIDWDDSLHDIPAD